MFAPKTTTGKKMKIITTLLTGLTLSAAVMAQAADSVKVGFVYVGPTGEDLQPRRSA